MGTNVCCIKNRSKQSSNTLLHLLHCKCLQGFTGKSECGDFKFTGIACIPAIPVIFEVNKKKVWTFYIYSLLRFFKFSPNFCGDLRRTCNPRDNYMHFTGYVLRHGDPLHFLWGKNLQCVSKFSYPFFFYTFWQLLNLFGLIY